MAPDPRVVLGLTVDLREGGKGILDFLDHLRVENGALSCQDLGEYAIDFDDCFVIVMSGITTHSGGESEDWTFAEALARANRSAETLAEGFIDISHLPTG